MYNSCDSVQIFTASLGKIALNNKKIKKWIIFLHCTWHEYCLINSHYKFFHLAQIEFIYVKKGKKKPNAEHPVQLGINRHSKLNDGKLGLVYQF